MYSSITSTVANLFKTDPVQKLLIQVTPVTGSSFNITEADVLSNGLTINRYCASGDSIQIGSCVAAELNMRLENGDGRFDSVVFEGAELYVRVGVQNGNSVSYVPLGYFTVDNIPRRLAILDISALDRMVQFDKPVNVTALNLPATVANIVASCCSMCNVTLNTNISSFPNASFSVSSIGEMENMTYRTILQWCAQIMGVCGYIDWAGQLRLGWFTAAKISTTDVTLTTADRYNSDLFENTIQITGIVVKGTENEALYGTDQYALVIEGNNLIPDSAVSTIANGLSSRVGFSYNAFNASALPMPYIYPLDVIKFVYKGTTYNVAVTEITFTSSAPTELKGTGESTQSRSYARINPLTSRERQIIDSLKNEMNTTLSRAVTNAIEFNDMITNALGLYITDVDDGNGGTIRYMHDGASLDKSSYIVTINAGGFAWTTDWNQGNPVWNYGITSSGFAMFKRLSAEGIDVTNIDSRYRAEVTPEHFNIYLDDVLVITIDAEDRAIKTPRIKIPYSNSSDNFFKIGNLMFFPVSDGVDVFLLGD